MGIKKLFFETAAILTFITLAVVTINSFQVYRNAAKSLEHLQTQYLNATFEIYKNEIIGDILIGNDNILLSLLNDIASTRGVGSILIHDKKILRTAGYATQLPLLTYKLNLGNEQFEEIQLYPLKNLQMFKWMDTILIPLALEMLILCFGFLLLLASIKRKLMNPLNNLVLSLGTGNIEKFSPTVGTVIELKQLCITLQKMNVDVRKKAQYEAESITAKQVAHDIRSPLACLNLLLSYVTDLPENHRVLMRASIQRITDVANVLQSKAKKINTLIELEPQPKTIMISSLLELLVTEKRIQLGLSTTVCIDLNIDKAYGLFAKINVTEFERVLSNLLDNSLEAFDDTPHHILIVVDYAVNEIIIRIEDDGKGIPAHLLDKMGTYGFSYGKDHLKSSGSGIGLYHAIKTIDWFGGTLTVHSTLDVGTSIVIKLPPSASPAWFVKGIELAHVKLVLILDDDDSIHNLWRERLAKQPVAVAIHHFASIQEFEHFVVHNLTCPFAHVLCLIDYEFVGQSVNGLSVIDGLNLNASSILVTSHYDDACVREEAMALGVGIIPKGVAAYVPLL